MRVLMLIVFMMVFPIAVLAEDDVEQGYGTPSITDSHGREKKFVDSDMIELEARENFTLNVCNKTNKDLKLALYNKLNNLVVDEDYAVMGWFEAKKNACTEIDGLPKGDFAFYANNGSGREWVGKDRKLCVENGRFKRFQYKESTCSKALLKGFTDIKIDSDYHTITISK